MPLRLCYTSKTAKSHASIVAILACLMLSSSLSVAASSSYRYKTPDGGTLFSDVPMTSSELSNGISARSSYRGTYGRRTATASCRGMTTEKLAARAAKHADTMGQFADTYNVDPNMVMAIAHIESCFDVKAQSSAGAQGIMQLMPATARELGVTRLFDAKENIKAGVEYFAKMSKKFNGNPKLALAAYNAGPGAVSRYNGIPPYPETQKYVVKVLAKYKEYSE